MLLQFSKIWKNPPFAICTASFSDDCTHGNETVLTSSDGYLAMFPRLPGGDGDHAASVSCPWILMTDAGRRFNLTWRLASTTSFGAANSLYDGTMHFDRCDTKCIAYRSTGCQLGQLHARTRNKQTRNLAIANRSRSASYNSPSGRTQQ